MQLLKIPTKQGLVYVNPALITYVVPVTTAGSPFVMTADGNGVIADMTVPDLFEALVGAGFEVIPTD